MNADAARRRLEEMLAELDRSRGTFAHPPEASDTGELSHLDQHPAEIASELTEQEREGALLAVVEEQRTEVLAALRRIENGGYGRCVDCGRELPEERLEARPEAARCVDCQHTLELAR